MPDVGLSIKIDMKAFKQAVEKAPVEIARSLKGAAKESAEEVLDTHGLRSYPPATSANMPPTPYYIRGRGTQYKSGNTFTSEQYGRQWNVKAKPYGVVIGNRASYAPFVGGEKSPEHMIRKGWTRLVEAALFKLPIIRGIYEKWIARALRRAGFK